MPLKLALAGKLKTRQSPSLETTVRVYLDTKAVHDKLGKELDDLKGDLKTHAFKAWKKGRIAETDTHQVKYVESYAVVITTELLEQCGVRPVQIEKILKLARREYQYASIVEKPEAKKARLRAERRGEQ